MGTIIAGNINRRKRIESSEDVGTNEKISFDFKDILFFRNKNIIRWNDNIPITVYSKLIITREQTD